MSQKTVAKKSQCCLKTTKQFRIILNWW